MKKGGYIHSSLLCNTARADFALKRTTHDVGTIRWRGFQGLCLHLEDKVSL